MQTHKLERSFDGKGEVKGDVFECVDERPSGYMFKRTSEHGDVCYEVFAKKTVPVCLDFDNRVYSDTEFKEVYPKSKDFGVWAWCFRDHDKAVKKLETL